MKRHYIVLIFLFLSLTLAAQKIALIEPRTGEGSTEISGMEKAMVRGELRKAIVNHTGFEAFTRADIDQLMKEQDFQRTGNVSQADIHKMGEMSGADFICISTLNKSDNEFYLEAYLINVETGAISNPASQYGELINGKLANMLPVCQALAQELLGTNTPIAQPVMKPSTPAPKQTTPTYNTKPTPTVTPAPRPQATTPAKSRRIGELMEFPDGSRGVVFYEKDGHGLVVSLDETVAKWENVKNSRQCHDISALPNTGHVGNYLTEQLGAEYTNAMVQQLGLSQAPAAAWCMQHGDGWYLPSAGELWYLFSEANEGSRIIPENGPVNEAIANGPICRAIINAGGQPFTNNKYWTSTENDNDDVFVVNGLGNIRQAEKPDPVLVRAIRAF